MFKTITKTLFASLVILGCSGEAQERKNVKIGSHSLPPQLIEILEEDRLEESLLEEEAEIELAGLTIPIKHQNFNDFYGQAVTTASYSPAIYHRINAFPEDSIVKLEDGSEWKFDAGDSHIVDTWDVNAVVVISPKLKLFWGSNYEYVMTNRETNESASVKLNEGPIEFGPYTTWVAVADWVNGHLHVISESGERTVWEVNPADVYLLKEWNSEETLFFGENTSWLWALSEHNHIIINVNMNHYIRARPIDSTPYIRAAAMRG